MSEALESSLHETRVFPPPTEFAARARLNEERLNALHTRFEADFEGTWADLARVEIDWQTPFSTILNSDCNAAGDPDIGDGQGNCNITRTRAAQALTQWLATKPTGATTDNILIIGDLNAYAKEDPITAIKNAGYVDQVERFDAPEDRYSYVYSAESGYLDHALASAALSGRIVGATHWHINADEPRALDYNEEYKTALQIQNLYSPEPYRASDHDPVMIGLALTRKTLLPIPTPNPNPNPTPAPFPPRLF